MLDLILLEPYDTPLPGFHTGRRGRGFNSTGSFSTRPTGEEIELQSVRKNSAQIERAARERKLTAILTMFTLHYSHIETIY